MSNTKPQALGVVIFFRRNENGTFDRIGQTPPMKYFTALEVYANTPNPASQLVGGDTDEEVNREADIMIENMKKPEYVEEYVDPYL
jgi:hypothetical protein